MKKNYLLLILCLVCSLSQAQVNQIYTDFNNFWTSSSTTINPTRPNLSHNLLAFKLGSTIYSTGVDNAKLANNGVTYQSTIFRALPINTVPLAGGTSYFIGFGALQDGNQLNTVDTFINPPITTGQQKAFYLTDGPNGLNLGTGLTNIPAGNLVTFNLSTTGIVLANVQDAIPDILVSQFAQPTGTNDELYFVGADGVTVIGSKVIINISETTSYPVVGRWNPDFYNNNSTGGANGDFINAQRDLRFMAANLSQFGLTASNYTLAKKLIYKPGGSSDPAFIAFNEPSIPIAAKLALQSQPTSSNCDGTMASSFTVKVTDSFGGTVPQDGFVITAAMYTGPGQLLGTVTATTNTSGIATFSNLAFEVGGDHQIQFTNSSLAPATSTVIAGPVCPDNVWTGNVNTAWNNTGNWQTAVIPNANNNVSIPAGRPNYPVLTANAGAKNLTLGAGATINLNGKLFTIRGNIVKDATAFITGSATGSELYMSGSAAQTIPAGFISGNLANFTVENGSGVTTNTALLVTEVARVISGNLQTNGNLTLVCSFSPRKTGIIGRSSGTISGNVTTEQCFPARRAFRYVSPSVTTTTSIRANWQENATSYTNNPNPGYGTHITGAGAQGTNPAVTDGANGFDWQPSGNPSMFTFNNGTQAWASVTSTLGNLTAGTPYRILIRGSRSTDITSNASAPTNTKLRATGTLAQGTVSVSGLNAGNGTWNLVGNPYHSVVDMNTVMASANNLTSFYYVYDPTLGGTPVVGQPGGRGAYVAVNTTTGVKSNVASEASRYLQPYQAFFVQTGTQGVTPSLIFTENSKVTNITQTNVFRAGMRPYIDMSLYQQTALDAGTTASDGVRIDFSEDDNNDADGNDAPKFTNLDENLSRKIDDVLIALENRNIAQAGDVLPLSILQYRTQNYSFKVEIGHFEELDVYLKDNYLNTQTLLSEEEVNIVPFSVDAAIDASVSESRFSIVFEAPAMGTGTFGESQFRLFPNPLKGSELFINASAEYQNADVVIYNTIGQSVYSTIGNFNGNSQLSLKVDTLPAGVYILKLKTNTGANFTTKFIKE